MTERLRRIGAIDNAVVNFRLCNGSDATELAVKAAYDLRRDKRLLVSFKGSYHGQNLTSYIISDLQQKHRFLITNNIDIILLKAPSHYDADAGAADVTDTDSLSLEYIKKNSNNIFAVILEPIQVNNSVNVPSPAFLKALSRICADQGVTLIFDEVQTGCGWLGVMSAAEKYGLKPDIIAVSKGLTAGFGPLAAMIANGRYGTLDYGTSEKTNGADLRSLIACNAVMDRLIGVHETSIPECASEQLRAELTSGLLARVPALSR
jgi:4-aminobutyrate aminotransferase-like enzyme